MSNLKARQVPTLPYLVSVGLIMPSVMVGVAILADRLVFGPSLWMLGWILGWPIGVGSGLGALRLWAERLPPTVWSKSAR